MKEGGMLRTSLMVLALATVLPTVAHAQSPAAAGDDGDSPLATVQALFDAMAAHDAQAIRKLMAPGTQMLVVGEDGKLHVGKDEGFLEAVAKDAASWEERAWDAKVTVDGPMAQVWAPYDFHHGGNFSHCGTNSVTLVHGEDGWRVVAIAYTMRKDDCPAGAPPR
jgi:hypothetical protein